MPNTASILNIDTEPEQGNLFGEDYATTSKQKKGNLIKQIINGPLLIKPEPSMVQLAIDYSGRIHGDGDSNVTLAKKYGKEKQHWSQYHVPATELTKLMPKIVANPHDFYLSHNEVWGTRRKIENLALIKMIWADLDFYNHPHWKKQNLEPDDMLQILKFSVFDKELPMPNVVKFSGNGISVEYYIENVPVTGQALALWNMVQEKISDILKDYGADTNAIDGVRVSRIPGTLNTKFSQYRTVRHVVLKEEKYTLRYFADLLLPERRPLLPKKDKPEPVKKSPNITKLLNIHSLHYERLKDICILQDLRMRKGYNEGYREMFCFLYRYWSCCFIRSPKQALVDTLEFNQNFLDPLHEMEVINNTKSAEKAYKKWLEDFEKGEKVTKGYNYKNVTLINKLEIAPEEQRHLNTIIGKEEKYRRNNERRRSIRRDHEGLTTRERDKLEKKTKAHELQSQGLKQKEIADILGVTSRYIRDLLKG